jgi:alkylation response protein AidB-like acyl-CoA dehydrogenase
VSAADIDALVGVVHEFVEREVRPNAGALEETGNFPRDLFQGLVDLGVVALTVPEQHGGLGLDTRSYIAVLEEISRGLIGLAGTLVAHMSVVGMLLRLGTDAQVRSLLPRLLAGDVGAMAMTEAGAGSDVRGIRATAQNRGGGYLLNGTKMFITSGGRADLYIILLRHGEGSSLFLVENGTPGMTFGPPLAKMGYHTSPTAAIMLDDVEVPRENLLGAPGRGIPSILGALDTGRIGVATMAVGLARAALDDAYSYIAHREQFGHPVLDFQALEFMTADMHIAMEAARQLVHHAADLKDGGHDYSAAASTAKVFATDAAMRVTTDAVQLLGGYGYTREYPVERYMREAKMLQIVEGTNQVQRVVIAKHMRRTRLSSSQSGIREKIDA